MRWVQKILLALRAILWRSRVEREMEAELAAHIEEEAKALMMRGADEAEAWRLAAGTMGHLELLREECRDARGTAWWERLKQDVGFGSRLLLKSRAFTLAALATLALAIGSMTAVYAIVDHVLLRPLPFAAPDRLYSASDVNVPGHFDTLRSNAKLADYAADLGIRTFTLRGNAWPERIEGSEVSANLFGVLGVAPLVGRDFAKNADRSGALRTAILSNSFWKRQYGGKWDVLGKQLVLDDVPYEIIGVMPAGFTYPAQEANFWIPMRLAPGGIGDYWGVNGCSTIARLHDSVTAEAAASELRGWTPRVLAMFPWRMPDSWASEVALEPMREHMVKRVRSRGLLIMSAVALVLLIAVVNVANLMIAQAGSRHGEFTLRIWLGATPGRLLRQVLTESVLLAMTGGLLGTLLAVGQVQLLKHWLPADTPRMAEVSIDPRILAFASAVSMGSGILFGLLPAWRARSRYASSPGNGERYSVSRRGVRADGALLTCEAAFATVLLAGAALLLHSLWRMMHAPMGYRVDSVITAELRPERTTAVSLDKTIALCESVRKRLASYPGVLNVAAMSQLPLSSHVAANTFAIEDHPRPPQAPQFPLWTIAVTPETLGTLGIKLLAGRGFTQADRKDAEPVVLIARSAAEKFWPGVNPTGRRIRPVWESRWRTVVGIVDDAKTYSLHGPPEWVDGVVYIPLAQAIALPASLAIVARVGNDPSIFELALPGLIRERCGACAVSKIALMAAVVSDAAAAPRSLAWLVGGFALLAVMLAAAGVYGIVSHSVIRRMHEIGIRLALGASPASAGWLVVISSLRQVAMGTAAGIVAAWVLARWMDSLLFGIGDHDAVSFSLPPVALMTVAVLASLAPMVRATRIDPARSLRDG